MKLKLAQLIEAREPLLRLAGAKYPVQTAYRIQRNLKAVDAEVNLYNQTRVAMIKNKYGETAERVPPEKIGEFVQEIGPLLNEEIDIDIWTLAMDSLQEITPLDMMALEWMFETPVESEEQPTEKKSPRRRRLGEL